MSESRKFNNDDYRELAEKIESGQYFQEAQDWYLKKYMYQFIERSYLIMLLLALLILGMFLRSYYHSILPIRKSLPIQVNISSAAEYSTRITYLGNGRKDFDVNDVYVNYFAGRFVEAIESYDYRDDFKKLRINKTLIHELASSDIYDYYMDKISIRNADSVILKYRKKIYRVINVDKSKTEIALIPKDKNDIYNDKNDDMRKYQATVNFTATEYDRNGIGTKSNWQAKFILSFQTIKYNFKEKDFSPLNFKVLSYESKRID